MKLKSFDHLFVGCVIGFIITQNVFITLITNQELAMDQYKVRQCK